MFETQPVATSTTAVSQVTVAASARPSTRRSLAHQRREVEELLDRHKLGMHAEALVRPAIRLVPRRLADGATPAQLGQSRHGGLPDLAAGVPWPRRGGKPLPFLVQIALEEIAPYDPEGLLPHRGLLSFFAGNVEPETEHGPLDVGRVLWCDDVGKLVRATPPPEGVRIYPPCALELVPAVKLPAPSHPIVTQRLSKPEQKRYEEQVWTQADEGHQLLGYRDRSWDAEQPLDVLLLYQSITDRETGTNWGEADHLYFYVPSDALAAHEFGRVFTYYGD
ncbi:MAG: YwqG family protein [Myxococcota bacterium]|nr:YwqG family protein [Myxococcota bacterium]MDW8361775.1 YwqG family protein [Myxococcales bacterium]